MHLRLARVGLALAGLALLACSATAQDAPPRQLRAGAAASNITPPLGGPIVGGFHPFPATHIHDELHARCLVLDNGAVRVAVVVCDLLGASQELYDEARRLVHAETGLPPQHLLMSSTHTHSAVSALGSNRFAFRQELDDYQKFVARRIADGVRRAINQLEPAEIGWAVGHEPNQVFNRRWHMRPGSIGLSPYGEPDQVKMNPPRASPNLLEPAGPTDPEVCVIAVRSTSGRPISLLANYSLHYVGGVGPGHVSADYFGMFCDRVQERLGADRQSPPFVALLSNGTSGDINNINFREPGERLASYVKMRQVADDVAAAALAAHAGVQYHAWIPLGGELRPLEVGVRRPSEALLARSREIVAAIQPDARTSLEEIYAERAIRMSEYPAAIEVPLQTLRIGDVGVSAIPCEVFVEIGLELKQRSPLKPSFTVSIANGYYGYLPTPEQHRLGGYETWLGTNRFTPDTSPKMVETLLAMLARLQQAE